MLKEILAYSDENFKESVERLFELLRIASISTDPAYAQECEKAADWLVAELTSIGFTAQAYKTAGHPIVLAQCEGVEENSKHVLFYGHYDVQPVDPINLWQGDPFEPRVSQDNKHIIARGASDDKGQIMTFIEACRAYKKVKGGFPVKITLLLEGEEEAGSKSLVPFLKEHVDKLKVDFALVCDTAMWDTQTPALTLGLRGCVAQEVVIKAANRDLHSGAFGGVAANPLKVLSQILGQLHDKEGRVTLEDFYKDVRETPKNILQMWEQLGCTAEDFLSPVGLSQPDGEKNRGILECLWARPTAEINGISGGYTGEGFKTVIPACASAKVSFRLVYDQNPQQVIEAFQKFVRERLPKDCQAKFIDHGASKAVQLPYDLEVLAPVKQALKDEWEKEAVLIAAGGSIPVVGDFQEILGLQSLLIGFGLEDDNIHSPNEKYDMRSFQKGQKSWIRILEVLGQQ